MPSRNQPFCPQRFFIIFIRYHNFYSCCGPTWFKPIDYNVQKKNSKSPPKLKHWGILPKQLKKTISKYYICSQVSQLLQKNKVFSLLEKSPFYLFNRTFLHLIPPPNLSIKLHHCQRKASFYLFNYVLLYLISPPNLSIELYHHQKTSRAPK